jgi:RNA polymerase sigma-32 factor
MGADSETEWQDWLADDSLDQETRLAESEELEERRTLLSTALEELTPRERDILEARRLKDEPVTLEDLSVKYDISRERVRQIEVRAFEKLQQKMKAALVSKRAETLDAR